MSITMTAASWRYAGKNAARSIEATSGTATPPASGEHDKDVEHDVGRQRGRLRSFEGRDPPLGGATTGSRAKHVQQAGEGGGAHGRECTRVMERGCSLRHLLEPRFVNTELFDGVDEDLGGAQTSSAHHGIHQAHGPTPPTLKARCSLTRRRDGFGGRRRARSRRVPTWWRPRRRTLRSPAVSGRRGRRTHRQARKVRR
jgi:hypothetical protein